MNGARGRCLTVPMGFLFIVVLLSFAALAACGSAPPPRTVPSALGIDLWRGGEPDPEARAKAYRIGLEVAAQYGLSGVFLHSWAAEPDQLGSSTKVEEMLRQSWVERE